MGRRDPYEPVYYIGVAARLVGVHAQTLRTYERWGFVKPHRSPSGRRLYSEADLERARYVRRLNEEIGLNLAGIDIVLRLLDKIEQLQAQVARLQEQLERGPRSLQPAPVEEKKTITLPPAQNAEAGGRRIVVG